MTLTYSVLKAATEAVAMRELDDSVHSNANAKRPLIDARNAVRFGGACVVLRAAELRALVLFLDRTVAAEAPGARPGVHTAHARLANALRR